MKKILYSIMALAISAFTLQSCEDVPAPYDIPGEGGNTETPSEVEPVGDGTEANPYNIAAALAATSTLAPGETTPGNLYIKGVVTSVKECSADFGNATFYLGDDLSSTKTFYVYRAKGLNNQNIKADDEVQEGDTIIVCGPVTNYSGTIETVQKGAYIYYNSRIGGSTGGGEVGEAKGDGTLENPYNSVAANNLAASLASDAESPNVYIKGKISSIKEEFGTEFGNATFYISDDGTSNGEFYVYRTLYFGNKKYTGGENIKVGDEVVIYGKVTNYMGNTPETVQNGSYLYSLNGKTGDNGGSDTPAEGEYINETFATSFGTFTVKTIKGQEWIIDFSTAKASGYVNKQNIESESYLVSPAIDLSNSKEACLSFEYILAYANNAGDNKVLITDNYNDASPASSSWEDITGTFAEYKDWNTFHKYSKAIPAKYIGKKNVRIAFYYNASATGSKTWEVRNVILKEGKPDADDNTGGGGNDDTGGDNTTPDEGSLLSNGTFEAWSGGQPVNWKTATTAGNASLKQSTDAHSGQYSVSVGYVASSNKRLGYKETELEAGKYVFSFWAKATKGGKSQTRPGYVPVTDGKVGNYVYGDYANLSTDWTQVTYEFELKEKTTICLVIMNPKGSNYSESQDILIDDAKLVKQ